MNNNMTVAWQLSSLFHCPSLFPIVFCLKFQIIKGKIIFAIVFVLLYSFCDCSGGTLEPYNLQLLVLVFLF